MSYARRDWFSENTAAEGLEAIAAGTEASSGKGAAISQGCLGTAKSVALIPVKASSAAANQVKTTKMIPFFRIGVHMLPRC